MNKKRKILLVGAEPDKMPRLKLVYKSLKSLGHDVKVFAPFQRKGNSIMRYLANMVKLFFERADEYHLFNIPDVIGVPLLFKRGRLIYDVRSPWKEVVLDSTGKKHYAKLAEIIEKIFCFKADRVVAVNPLLKERAESFGAKDVIVVPNFPYEKMSTEGWEDLIDVPEMTILYFGKISKVEGSEILGKIIVDTIEKSDEFNRPDLGIDLRVRFIIAGDGPEKEVLRKKIADAKVFDRVHFLGWVPHEDIGKWIRAVDVCIMPREEFGTSNWIHPDSVWKVNEALNIGTQILATRIGGFKENLEDLYPLYITENKDFVRHLLIMARLRKMTRKAPNNRDWKYCRDRLEEVYGDLR